MMTLKLRMPLVTGDPDEEELATIIGDAVETVEAESHSLEANLAANLETAEAVEEFEGNERQAFEPQVIERNTVAVEDETGHKAGLAGPPKKYYDPKEKPGPRTTFAGYIRCSYCGGLNPRAYKGSCPQCPKHSSVALASKAETKGEYVYAKEGQHEVKRLQSLQGRVLNIVEAAIADKSQREAVKKLVNKEFRRTLSLVVPGSDEVLE